MDRFRRLTRSTCARSPSMLPLLLTPSLGRARALLPSNLPGLSVRSLWNLLAITPTLLAGGATKSSTHLPGYVMIAIAIVRSASYARPPSVFSARAASTTSPCSLLMRVSPMSCTCCRSVAGCTCDRIVNCVVIWGARHVSRAPPMTPYLRPYHLCGSRSSLRPLHCMPSTFHGTCPPSSGASHLPLTYGFNCQVAWSAKSRHALPLSFTVSRDGHTVRMGLRRHLPPEASNVLKSTRSSILSGTTC